MKRTHPRLLPQILITNTPTITIRNSQRIPTPGNHLQRRIRLRARPPVQKRIASPGLESRDPARRVVQAGDAAVVRGPGAVRVEIGVEVTADYIGAVDGGLLVRGPAGGVVGCVGGLDVDGGGGGFGDCGRCQLVGK